MLLETLPGADANTLAAAAAPRPITPRELLAAAVGYALLLLLLVAVTGRTPTNDGRGHDGKSYAAMSNDETLVEPFIAKAPYCYRLLTPGLASLLPGPVVTRFVTLNTIAWLAALVGWHLLARRTGLGVAPSAFGSLILGCSAWGPMNAFYNPCYVDPMMHLFVILGLNLMLSRSRWLAVLLPLSVLQREQTAGLILICAVVHDWHLGRLTRRRAVWHGGILAACAAVYIAVRLAIQPTSGSADNPFTVASWLIHEPTYPAISIMAVIYALGVPLVGLAVLPGARAYIRQHRWPLYFLYLCLLSLFGGSDKARLAFVAQPVLVLLLMHGLGRIANRRTLGIVLAGLLATHLYLQFPPGLMTAGGRLIAPLIDDPDRLTHVASWTISSHWPIGLLTVAAHLVLSVCLAGVVLCAARAQAAAPDTSGFRSERGVLQLGRGH